MSEAYYTKIYGKTYEEVKRTLVRAMRATGAHRLEAEYDGGHDEGGIRSLTCFNSKGEELKVELTYESEIWQACDEVMATRYYTWALEGYVCGTLFADLDEGRIWTNGQEEHTEYVPMADPIDWSV